MGENVSKSPLSMRVAVLATVFEMSVTSSAMQFGIADSTLIMRMVRNGTANDCHQHC